MRRVVMMLGIVGAMEPAAAAPACLIGDAAGTYERQFGSMSVAPAGAGVDYDAAYGAARIECVPELPKVLPGLEASSELGPVKLETGSVGTGSVGEAGGGASVSVEAR